jgi:hypothetical protein
MFLRNILADFGGRSAEPNKGKFTPYFQYKIGKYQPDYFLYFPKEPFTVRYKNEVFNKLQEYTGYDITRYLDFHYAEYDDKAAFLKFLKYEASERLKKNLARKFHQKLQSVQEWIIEKERELKSSLVSAPVNETLQADLGLPKVSKDGNIDLLESTALKFQQLVTNVEDQMGELANSFPTGSIQLNNHYHLEKVIQALILLQTVKAPDKIAKSEQLFKGFSATDLAFMLNLHFSEFKNMKPNTVQVKVKECNDRIKPDNIKVRKLTEALQDFFY